MKVCWLENPSDRPKLSELKAFLNQILCRGILFEQQAHKDYRTKCSKEITGEDGEVVTTLTILLWNHVDPQHC